MAFVWLEENTARDESAEDGGTRLRMVSDRKGAGLKANMPDQSDMK